MKDMKNSLFEDFKLHESTKEGKQSIFNFITLLDKKDLYNINEALIHTYNHNRIKQYVMKYFGLEDWQYRVIKLCNNVVGLNIVVPSMSDRIEEIKKILDNSFGWYYTNGSKVSTDSGKEYTVLRFRPKFSNREKIDEEINKNPVLWHVTPLKSYEKIKRQGLIPKAKNTLFDYYPKIYFLPGNFKYEDALRCYKTISKYTKHKDEDWVVLKVDVRKKDGSIPKFYYDPDYTGALYTFENIRPSNIELVDVIKKKKEMNLKEAIEYIKDNRKKIFKILDTPFTYDNMQ